MELDLSGFHGTEGYTRWSALFPSFLLTDGCKYVAEEAGAYWLMDLIASHVQNRNDNFSHVKLVRVGEGAEVSFDDGNGKIWASQRVEWTDFPLEKINLYVVDSEKYRVIMLPSEY